MSNCSKGTHRRIVKTLGTTVVEQYLDLTTTPATVLTAEEWAALSLVCCPKEWTKDKVVCIRPIGNEDPLAVVGGCLSIPMTTTYSDLAGTVDTVTPGTPMLLDDNGVDVTATHEVTACVVWDTIETDACVTGGEKKVTEKEA